MRHLFLFCLQFSVFIFSLIDPQFFSHSDFRFSLRVFLPYLPLSAIIRLLLIFISSSLALCLYSELSLSSNLMPLVSNLPLPLWVWVKTKGRRNLCMSSSIFRASILLPVFPRALPWAAPAASGRKPLSFCFYVYSLYELTITTTHDDSSCIAFLFIFVFPLFLCLCMPLFIFRFFQLTLLLLIPSSPSFVFMASPSLRRNGS